MYPALKPISLHHKCHRAQWRETSWLGTFIWSRPDFVFFSSVIACSFPVYAYREVREGNNHMNCMWILRMWLLYSSHVDFSVLYTAYVYPQVILSDSFMLTCMFMHDSVILMFPFLTHVLFNFTCDFFFFTQVYFHVLFCMIYFSHVVSTRYIFHM